MSKPPGKMNADRESVLLESMRETLMELKDNVWKDIDSMSGAPSKTLEQKVLSRAEQDLNHVEKLNNMLDTTKELSCSTADTKQCDDAVTFRKIASFFHNNTERFLRQNPVYTYDFDKLVEEIEKITGQQVEIEGDFLPYFSLKVADYFVKFIFSVDYRPSFIVVHGNSEQNRSPFEQSDSRVFRTLAVYFSRVLPDFMLKYKHRGLIEFIIWLSCYHDLFTTPCAKCGKLIHRDLTGDLLPPIKRTVKTCRAYHIECAPFETEMPDFGYVTLMSEDQVQENRPNVQK